MGGGTKVIQSQPAPPPVSTPSTADAMREYVNALPQLYQAQLDYAPKEAQQQLDLARQYAAPLGQVYRDAQNSIMPGFTQLQDTLAQQANQGISQGLSQGEIDLYKDQFKSLVGDQANSGLGADFIGKNLMTAQQGRQDYFRNLGLTLAGMQPLAQPGNPSFTNQLAQYNPNSVMNFMGGNYQSQLAYYRPSFNTVQKPDYLTGIGNLFNGIGSMGSFGK